MNLDNTLNSWVWQKTPKVIADKVILIDEGFTVRHIMVQWCDTVLKIIHPIILEDWRIKVCHIELEKLTDLLIVLDPNEIYIVLKYCNKILDKIEEEALNEECYEGLENLRKLKLLL